MVVTPVISDEMCIGQGVALTVYDTSVTFDERYVFFCLKFTRAAADANVVVRVLVVFP
jgi:hypothetical protein